MEEREIMKLTYLKIWNSKSANLERQITQSFYSLLKNQNQNFLKFPVTIDWMIFLKTPEDIKTKLNRGIIKGFRAVNLKHVAFFKSTVNFLQRKLNTDENFTKNNAIISYFSISKGRLIALEEEKADQKHFVRLTIFSMDSFKFEFLPDLENIFPKDDHFL